MTRGGSAGIGTRLPIYAMLGATALSQVGNMLTFVAVPWFVLQTTGSAALTGISGAAVTLAAVLASLFGGPVVDRLGFKQTSVVSDLASGLTVAAIPLLYLTVGLEFWQLLALLFLGSVLDTPGMTARQGMIPDLSRRAGMPVERPNSAYQAIQQGSFLVGPPVAGVLIAVFGASNVLFLDAATFAVSALLILVAVPLSRRAGDEQGGEGYLAELVGGLRFVWGNLAMRTIILAAVVCNFLASPLLAVILPVYADRFLGSATGLGAMLAGFGGGALVGAVFYGAVGRRLPRRGTLIVCLGAFGLPLLVLAAQPPLAVAVAALGVCGLVNGPINPIIFTFMHERTPTAMLGRALGVLIGLAMAAAPLGMVVAGFALETAGIGGVLTGIVVLYLATTAFLLLSPALRDMDGALPGADAAETIAEAGERVR